MRRAVFVDRDGVLNAAVVVDGRPFPPASAHGLQFLPGVRARIDELRRLDMLLICVTNQPDVARGTASRSAVEAVNERVRVEMGLDELLACYHDDADQCACRKPRPGLLLAAAARLDIDLPHSYMIGDRWRDVGCGAAAGCITVFVDYGYGETYRGPAPAYTCASAAQAFDLVLSRERG
jgi:D-glycero-D-manno-heptose 1,7-bisphosphate phosphatase